MSPVVKSSGVFVAAASIVAALDKLVDPSTCSAFLSSHGGAVSLASGILAVVTLWLKSPKQ
jgi:hypothetical protein